jgi:hypothetical protein
MGPRGKPLVVVLALALATLASVLGACGQSDPAEGLISNIDKARSARTLTSLQQGLITAQVVGAESGGSSAPALVTALQQRDPSNRYTTAPPTDVGIVQVVGGGGGPVMLVGISAPPSAPRPPAYLAVWEAGGTTLYYIGREAPQYSTSPPGGAGWSTSPPLA